LLRLPCAATRSNASRALSSGKVASIAGTSSPGVGTSRELAELLTVGLHDEVGRAGCLRRDRDDAVAFRQLAADRVEHEVGRKLPRRPAGDGVGPLRQARGLLDLRLHERGLRGRADPDAGDVREFVDLRLRHLLHLLRGHIAFHGGLDVLLHEALVIGA
jgi:hypothetical protein